MSKKTHLRIINDIVDFQENRPDGIYFHVNKDNFYKNYALIIGPKNTPYFGGYFFFEINFPKNYPKSPPQAKMLTIGANVRFNPNLYENGKVCLSILGTWQGPKWKPIMNLRLVLLSIQSLMGHHPIHNEPGYEKVKPNDIRSVNYNKFIIYNTYKLAIINVIDGKYKKVSKFFKKEINENMKENMKALYEDLLSYKIIYGIETIKKHLYFLPSRTLLNFEKLEETFNIKMKKFDIKNET
jgi:ubiquitin-protein ligase